MKTAEEMRIDFYGKYDARAYEYDELYLMKEYAQERTKDMYLKEFAEFCISDSVFEDEREESPYIYLIWDNESREHFGFETLDELYQYWLTNIKK